MRYRHEPHWRLPQPFRLKKTPSRWRYWLAGDQSLTAYLQRQCWDDFQVKVVCQTYARTQLNEARVLAIAANQYAWIREVCLYCGQQPMVYARSVIPCKTLTGPQRRLLRFGQRPLGGWLFTDPGIRKGQREWIGLNCSDPLFERATACLDKLGELSFIWGRRTVFFLSGRPILVSEFFLPSWTSLAKSN